MKIADALAILKLSSGASQEEIAKAYKAAAKQFHPDLNPDNPAAAEMMKLVNAAFDELKKASSTDVEEETGASYSEDLNAALQAIIHLEGLEIEICGSWIWVGGETKQHRVALKAAGFKYAKKKQKWNFRPANWKSSSRGSYSMERIREHHGSVRPARPQAASYHLEAAA